MALLQPLTASANKVYRKKGQEALKKMAEDTGIRTLMEIFEESEHMKWDKYIVHIWCNKNLKSFFFVYRQLVEES